ncbi:MAG: hypothetical protein D6682_02625 [Zetaproteobacteria bacterium]|nr:MAG: hypothetical protein D6682_02625 [Zetaproteobacteria bacterium]
MGEHGMRPRWRPGRRDVAFLAVVGAVITALVVGSGERTTKAVPDDATHRVVTDHAACLACHGKGSARPQPPGHTRAVQCFQCHAQPAHWIGGSKR